MKSLKFVLLTCAFSLNLFAINCNNPIGRDEINECILSTYEKADKKLNLTYGQLIKKLNPDMKANLKKSQKAWLQFVDTEREIEESIQCLSGNCSSIVTFGTLETKTKRVIEREKELQQHLIDLP
jgi:uncharacterized protein YecT (DUF1311 family)